MNGDVVTADRLRGILALAVAAAAVLFAPVEARALPGDARLGCLSGDTQVGPSPGSGACALTAGAAAGGTNSGLGELTYPVASADGRNVYAATFAGVVTFNRDPATGALTFAGCITGDENPDDPCTEIAGATASGSDSGLGNVSGIALAADDRNLYVTAQGDDAVATFSRNPSTGALSFVECHSGQTGVCGNPQNGGLFPISKTVTGSGTGFNGTAAIAVHPNDEALVTASRGDDAITAFIRNPDGRLQYAGCFTGDTGVGSGGSGACNDAPLGTSNNGSGSGFDGVSALAFSPDGLNLYATAQLDHSLISFADGGGGLEFERCVTGDRTGSGSDGTGRCFDLDEGAGASVPLATADGSGSPLESPALPVVSPDGLDIYVISPGAGVSHFTRGLAPPDPEQGAPLFFSCISGLQDGPAACAKTPKTGDYSGLLQTWDAEIAPDGANLYVQTSRFFSGSDGVATLRRTGDGSLAFTRCLTGDTLAGPAGSGACSAVPGAQPGAINSGLSFASGLAIAPGGEHLYSTSFADSAISWLGDEPDAAAPVLRLSGRKKQSSRKRITVRAKCDEACRVTIRAAGKAKVKVRSSRSRTKTKKVRLNVKPVSKTVTAGKKATFRLRFRGGKTKRLVRRAIRTNGTIKLKLVGRASDTSGNRSRAGFTLTIR
jgi:hypothetical protein